MDLFNLLCEYAPFGVFYTDAKGSLTYCNEVFAQICGLTKSEALGFGRWDLLHSRDRERVLHAWDEALTNKAGFDLVVRLIRPSGERRYARMKARPMPAPICPEQGFLVIAHDVTQQVEAERRLRNNNKLLGVVLDTVPCGVTVFDAKGALILDNQRARTMLDFPEDPSIPVSDFGTLAAGADGGIYPDTASGWGDASESQPRTREEQQPDGRVLEVRDAPMPGGGLVTTYTDITQHKQAIESLQEAKEVADRAAAAKASFLAVMSHEIRTPMNGVIGMTNVLLETELSADQRELVEVIKESGESLLVVINDILDFSKIDSGQMQLEWLPLRLHHVVETSIRLLAGKAEEKGVSLSFSIAHGVPALIYGDKTRLQQVLVNLLSNSVRFTDQGSVAVEVSLVGDANLRSSQSTGDLIPILVSVVDTGVGVPPDKLDAIFEPFVQADSSTARRFGGTGLGLAIAKRLVDAMGGKIAMSSTLGKGTRVTFTFLAEAAAPDGSAANASANPLEGQRALLWSPVREQGSFVAAQLRRWGLDPVVCSSGAELRSSLSLRRPAVVVLCAAAEHGAASSAWQDLIAEGCDLPVLWVGPSPPPELRGRPGCTVAAEGSERALFDALVLALRSSVQPDPARKNDSQFDRSFGEKLPLRILLVEDNEINRKVATRMLRDFGYAPDIAENGRQAVDAVLGQAYDLVLMDIQMPEMDGIEATRAIASRLAPADRPRIVAMSANVMAEHVDAARRAGVDDFIGKPFSVAALRHALEQAAGRRGARAGAGTGQPTDALLTEDRVRTHFEADGSGAFLEELLASLDPTIAASLQKMRSALGARDAALLRSIAHELAGVGAVLGATRLQHACSGLEQRAQAGDLEGAQAVIEDCAALAAASSQAIRRLLGRWKQAAAAAGN